MSNEIQVYSISGDEMRAATQSDVDTMRLCIDALGQFYWAHKKNKGSEEIARAELAVDFAMSKYKHIDLWG